jgi:hypothetical protein
MFNTKTKQLASGTLALALALQCAAPTFAASIDPASDASVLQIASAGSNNGNDGNGQTVLHGSASQGVDLLNAQIAKKEVELLKLNTDFRTHYTARDKNKQRRMNAYDFASGAVANAGDITLLSQFWKYQRIPGAGLNRRGRLEAGVITVLVAYTMLGGMYTAEGVGDLISDYRSKRQHFDAKSMRERAVAIKDELERLLKARATAIAEMPNLDAGEREYLSCEEKVLRDLKDLGLLEFSKLYIDSRKRHAQRDITTIGTLAVCATGAFPGALGVLAGIRHTNTKQIGGGGVGFLISGATLTAAPVLIYGGGAVTAKVAGERLSKQLGELQCRTTDKLHQDTDCLARLLPTTPLTVALQPRLSTYQEMTKFLTERATFLDKDRRQQKRDMIERFVTYAAEGGPQIAWGTCVARAGYRWGRNPYKLFKGVASGATVNEVAWGTWMLSTAARQTRNEIRNAKNAKEQSQAAFSETNDDLKRLEAIKAPPATTL